MRIAVIIPCYRQSHFLWEALESVRKQTRKPDRVVVVAGSDEDSRAARQMGEQTMYVPPEGLADARNKGIEAVYDCDAILPLDADDKLAPTAIEELAEAAPFVPMWIVGSDVQEFGDRANLWQPQDWHSITTQNCLPYASLFPRELWQAAGGYDPGATWAEDWDFWLRCWKCMGVTQVVTQLRRPLLLYRIHAESKSAKERGVEAEEREKLLRRHGFV